MKAAFKEKMSPQELHMKDIRTSLYLLANNSIQETPSLEDESARWREMIFSGQHQTVEVVLSALDEIMISAENFLITAEFKNAEKASIFIERLRRQAEELKYLLHNRNSEIDLLDSVFMKVKSLTIEVSPWEIRFLRRIHQELITYEAQPLSKENFNVIFGSLLTQIKTFDQDNPKVKELWSTVAELEAQMLIKECA